MQAPDLLIELFGALPRQGPGCPAATREALRRLGLQGATGLAADMGCGSGAAARVLAAETEARVLALDLHVAFLRQLQGSGRILPVCADMARPPLAAGSLDLLWAEGSIYLLGFEAGLRLWRPLLRPGGAIAVSEATWLVDEPPAEAQAYWREAYPAMTDVRTNLTTLRACGFEPLEPFVLPEEGWREGLYGPLAAALEPFALRHAGDPVAAALVTETRREIEQRDRYGQSYGYVFYLARAA